MENATVFRHEISSLQICNCKNNPIFDRVVFFFLNEINSSEFERSEILTVNYMQLNSKLKFNIRAVRISQINFQTLSSVLADFERRKDAKNGHF